MNLIDKAIEFFSPRAAARREWARARLDMARTIKNTGFGNSGASTQKKSLAGWIARSRSPQEDIDPHLNTLRQRSRDLLISSPLAVSAVRTKTTNVVGPGLALKSRIDALRLGRDSQGAADWERDTEREFALWAGSRHSDALKINNFHENQALAYASWKANGDAFALIKYADPTSWMPYGLRIHLIEADRVSTPNVGGGKIASWLPYQYSTVGKNDDNGNTIYSGVEIDNSGAIVAYWICNQYPSTGIFGFPTKKKEWTRVEAYSPNTGAPNIIHLYNPERCEQYRGVPMLAPVIETLKQITRYQEAELMAALVQALYTVFIEVKDDPTEIPLGESIQPGERLSNDDVTYELGPGTVNVLGDGEKATFADPKRPASGFEPFINTMAKTIGAALEIPFEILMKHFSASYSASRAALLEAWKSFKTERTLFSADFCQPIYELWIAEAVARERITAPGFFVDQAIRAAWSKSEWTGPTQGQIDPVKEVTAAILRVKHAFSTHEQETVGLTGGNWDDNIQQIALENELLRLAGDAGAVTVNYQEGGEKDGKTD